MRAASCFGDALRSYRFAGGMTVSIHSIAAREGLPLPFVIRRRCRLRCCPSAFLRSCCGRRQRLNRVCAPIGSKRAILRRLRERWLKVGFALLGDRLSWCILDFARCVPRNILLGSAVGPREHLGII